jgi:hypothetical protein
MVLIWNSEIEVIDKWHQLKPAEIFLSRKGGDPWITVDWSVTKMIDS